jgi:hypothetical protein
MSEMYHNQTYSKALKLNSSARVDLYIKGINQQINENSSAKERFQKKFGQQFSQPLQDNESHANFKNNMMRTKNTNNIVGSEDSKELTVNN